MYLYTVENIIGIQTTCKLHVTTKYHANFSNNPRIKAVITTKLTGQMQNFKFHLKGFFLQKKNLVHDGKMPGVM